MYVSQTRFIFALQVLLLGLVILSCCVVGLFTGQPAAMLSILALHYMPQFPVIPDISHGDEEPGEYDGGNGFGFLPVEDDANEDK